jgi:HEAT repeat protein
VPALTKALRDGDWFVRSAAGKALGEYGPDAKSAIPELTKTLNDADGHVRVAAAFALYRIDGKPDTAVPVLIEVLNSKEEGSYAPASAAQTLGKIGPPAKEAIPDLTASLSNKNRGLRICAAGALWRITNESDSSLPILIKAVKDGESVAESDTHQAIEILEDMGPQAKAAVPALLAAHARTEGWARDMLERVLKRIDPEASKKIGPR